MKFYSYEYVLSQIDQQNSVMIGFGVFLLAITGFFAFKAYRDHRGTKFRELVMISSFGFTGCHSRYYIYLSVKSSFQQPISNFTSLYRSCF